jgi:hypothetical protein
MFHGAGRGGGFGARGGGVQGGRGAMVRVELEKMGVTSMLVLEKAVMAKSGPTTTLLNAQKSISLLLMVSQIPYLG